MCGSRRSFATQVGDGNNIVNSWLELACVVPFDFVCAPHSQSELAPSSPCGRPSLSLQKPSNFLRAAPGPWAREPLCSLLSALCPLTSALAALASRGKAAANGDAPVLAQGMVHPWVGQNLLTPKRLVAGEPLQ